MAVAAVLSAPRPEPRWLRAILSATLIFNLVDAVLTLLLVTMGAAEESNPLMAGALAIGPVPFMLVKLGLVSIGVGILWRQRTRWIAMAGSVAVFLVYVALMAVHVESVRILVDSL
jgi:uncharacterized membrane protein YqjE